MKKITYLQQLKVFSFLQHTLRGLKKSWCSTVSRVRCFLSTYCEYALTTKQIQKVTRLGAWLLLINIILVVLPFTTG